MSLCNFYHRGHFAELLLLTGFSPHYWLYFPVLILCRLAFEFCWRAEFSPRLIFYNSRDKTLGELCLMPATWGFSITLMGALHELRDCSLAVSTFLTCMCLPVLSWRSRQAFCRSLTLFSGALLSGLCPEKGPRLLVLHRFPALSAHMSSLCGGLAVS